MLILKIIFTYVFNKFMLYTAQLKSHIIIVKLNFYYLCIFLTSKDYLEKLFIWLVTIQQS